MRACVFDAYGTLFDFASAARRCRDVLGDSVDRLTALWRDRQLQYTWLRAAQGRHADFWQVTGDALDFSLDTLNLNSAGLRDRLMSLYLALEPFPEVKEVLGTLKAAGLRTAILSNGSPAMLDAAVKSAEQGHSSTWSCLSKKLGYTSHIQGFITWRSIGLASPRQRFHFNLPILGMPMLPRHLAYRSFGVIAIISAMSGCPVRRIEKSDL